MPVRVTTANGCFAAQRPPDTASGLLAMLRSCGRHTRLGTQLTPSPSMLSRDCDAACAQCVDTHELVVKRHPRPDLLQVLTTALQDLSFGVRRLMGRFARAAGLRSSWLAWARAPSRSSIEDPAPRGSEVRVPCWSS